MAATDSKTAASMDNVSFVARSKSRRAVLESLDDGPATPSDLANKTDVKIAHVSRSLRKLRQENMVELLVDEETKKGRYYGIDDLGSATLAKMNEVGV